MANINRDYLCILDVKTGNIQSPEMIFVNTDVNTSNIYVQLCVNELSVNVSPVESIEQYTLEMQVIKPNNTPGTIQGILVNTEESIFEFNLPNDFIELGGIYLIEFWVKSQVNSVEEIITSNSTKYTVNNSITTQTLNGDNAIKTTSLQFNADGDLVVSINGVSKIFSPKS